VFGSHLSRCAEDLSLVGIERKNANSEVWGSHNVVAGVASLLGYDVMSAASCFGIL
jgi:hypothetical protein